MIGLGTRKKKRKKRKKEKKGSRELENKEKGYRSFGRFFFKKRKVNNKRSRCELQKRSETNKANVEGIQQSEQKEKSN